MSDSDALQSRAQEVPEVELQCDLPYDIAVAILSRYADVGYPVYDLPVQDQIVSKQIRVSGGRELNAPVLFKVRHKIMHSSQSITDILTFVQHYTECIVRLTPEEALPHITLAEASGQASNRVRHCLHHSELYTCTMTLTRHSLHRNPEVSLPHASWKLCTMSPMRWRWSGHSSGSPNIPSRSGPLDTHSPQSCPPHWIGSPVLLDSQ